MTKHSLRSKPLLTLGLLFAGTVLLWLSFGNRLEVLFAASVVDDGEPGRPVLLELFTSQGCSSCPRADALLSELAERQPYEGVEIIPLSLHVDYWNYLGWADPFSDPSFSKRQRAYAETLPERGSVYTPQLVVDGRFAVVGSDRSGARRAVMRATEQPHARLAVESTRGARANELGVVIRIAPHADLGARDAELFVALAQNGLALEVARGENRGRRLAHTSVVRKLEPLGTVTISLDETVTRSMQFTLDPKWSTDTLHVVAWVSDERDRFVLGAARAEVLGFLGEESAER